MRPPVIARTPGEVLDATLGAVTVGLVPTMGALHEGHLSLIRRADAENDDTVVSIFVNPTQFNDPDDLARYPRTPDADIALAHEAGARIFYMPAVETVYPAGFATCPPTAR
jgi:pantoate--beta-alanine ligase